MPATQESRAPGCSSPHPASSRSPAVYHLSAPSLSSSTLVQILHTLKGTDLQKARACSSSPFRSFCLDIGKAWTSGVGQITYLSSLFPLLRDG